MLLIFTGNGKGKTTAALGQMLRAVGEGHRTIMLQFIKGPWISGEDKICSRLSPDFEIIKGGKGFVGILGDKLPRKAHQEAAQKTLALAQKKIVSKKYGLVVLDEANVALSLKLITLRSVKNLIKKIPQGVNVILTGREAPAELIKQADLVTEMREIKHPYQKGVQATKGIDF